jgi:hypothetical protein
VEQVFALSLHMEEALARFVKAQVSKLFMKKKLMVRH